MLDRSGSELAITQLVKASQHLNRMVRDLAAGIPRTGELPTTAK